MLEGIKSMIQEKTQFVEAAGYIFEDGSGKNLDDILVLGEESEIPAEINDNASITEGDDEPEDNDSDNKNKEDNDSDDSDDGDIMDTPINGDKPDHHQDVSDEPVSSSLLDTPINGEPDSSILTSDLPEPIGAQTGEEINPGDDLLNVEIDLGSNTVKDVLPVPPANAIESLEGGADNQHIDSGFSNEQSDGDIPGANDVIEAEENVVESMIDSFFPKQNKSFEEAISIGDAPPAETPTDTPAPAEETPAIGDEPIDDGGESEVTSAVRDKVAEADIPAAGGNESGKEALLKKLGTLTKGLEDAKKAVMDSIS